jgi:hypothetical protein
MTQRSRSFFAGLAYVVMAAVIPVAAGFAALAPGAVI